MSIPIPVRNLVVYLRHEIRTAVAIVESQQLTVLLQDFQIDMACTSADGLPIAPVVDLGQFSLNDGSVVSKAASELLDRLVLVDLDSLQAAHTDTVCRLQMRFVP